MAVSLRHAKFLASLLQSGGSSSSSSGGEPETESDTELESDRKQPGGSRTKFLDTLNLAPLKREQNEARHTRLVLHLAETMRRHGPRLDVTLKNTGHKEFAINSLQAQFLPSFYQPPSDTLTSLLGKDNS
jgi:hypothetical protein